MELYVRAARIPDNEKVTITSMYLSGDAKLWWRTRMADDASANWGTLKKELKDQFLHYLGCQRESKEAETYGICSRLREGF